MYKDKTLILKKTKFFLDHFNQSKFPEKNNFFYISTTTNFIGFFTLKKILNYKYSFIKDTTIILKDFLYCLKYVNYSCFYNSKIPFYNKIFITWALDGNFKNDGSLEDRYLNINSKQLKDTLWFVIFVGKKIPKKINKNIVLLSANHNISMNLKSLFNFFIKKLSFILKSPYYFLNSISNHNFFADIFLNEISKLLNKNIKLIYMPFEGQPFQNKFLFYVNKYNKKIKTLGYIHSAPLALPTNFIYKKNSCPQKIIINGKDQFFCFNRFLGWKKSNLKIEKSFRFLKNHSIAKKNIIYLPIQIKSIDSVISNLKKLIVLKKIDLKKYDIKNHPAAHNSKINKKLINNINVLKKEKNPHKNKKQDNLLIFIGSSGAIVESLERGAKVVQISESEIFDTYSNKLYPSLSMKKISQNIYEYKLKKKKQLINFGSKKINLKKINRFINYV